MENKKFKLILIGILIGVIGTLLLLRLLSIPWLIHESEIDQDMDSYTMDLDQQFVDESSESADTENF